MSGCQHPHCGPAGSEGLPMRRASGRTHTSEVCSGAPRGLAVPLWRGWAQEGSCPQGCAQALSSHSGGPAPGRRWGGCWWCQARGLRAVLGTTAQPSSIQLVWLDSLKPGGTAPRVAKALQDTSPLPPPPQGTPGPQDPRLPSSAPQCPLPSCPARAPSAGSASRALLLFLATPRGIWGLGSPIRG